MPGDEDANTPGEGTHTETFVMGAPKAEYWEQLRWDRLTPRQRDDDLNSRLLKFEKVVKALAKLMGIAIAAIVAYAAVEAWKSYRIQAIVPPAPAPTNPAEVLGPDRQPPPTPPVR